uniref:Uncharacterized protein n=1 Tax=Panagrolaimus sp. JU765 TaxID=591449 RepID=A0AC34Q3K1_9BILA
MMDDSMDFFYDQKKAFVNSLYWLKQEGEKRCLFETALWADECLQCQPEDMLEKIDYKENPLDQYSKKIEMLTNFVRSLIRNQEYHRAVYFSEQFPKPLTPLHCFLLHFSCYMVALKNKAESDPDVPVVEDTILGRLIIKMEMLRLESPDSFDCWMLYLLGMIMKTNKEDRKARTLFCEAITAEWKCWPAWDNLALLITDKSELITLKSLPLTVWYYKLFSGKVYQRLNLIRDAIDIYEDLTTNLCGTMPYIVGENATATAALQEHDPACDMFKSLRGNDPYRIQHMEVYADSLYIRSRNQELYTLARFFEKSHKFTWQSCTIMANYFSRTGQHDRAQKILVTATKLSPKNALIWILLGHECMELKDPTDAVTAYYKALEIDPLQHRAYYGLGQLYEIFKYTDFALYFYEQAHRCRPNDSRFLVAIGVVLFHLHRNRDAENAFIRAFKAGDIQGNALVKLANLYESEDKPEKAFKAYSLFLKVYSDEIHSDQNMICNACLFLAKYYLERGNFDEANNYAQRCLVNEHTKEEGLRVINHVKLHNASPGTVDTTSKPYFADKMDESVNGREGTTSMFVELERDDGDAMALSDDDDDISFS